MQMRSYQALGVLLALGMSGTAVAQTSDGVGGRTDTIGGDQSAEEAAEEVDELIDLYEYQPRYYSVSTRMWAIGTPSFVLDGPFSLHTNMWQDGVANFSYGFEFTTRIPDKFDVVVGLDWANLRTADGFWLEDGDPIRDADYTESNLSLINADVSLRWFTNLNNAETVQLYYGFGLGMGLVLGEFSKYDIDVGQCGWTTEERGGDDVSLITDCANENDDPYVPVSRPEDRIPPVLPALSATLGTRFLVADSVSIGIEGGWKSLYAYGGLNVGYYWNALR